MRLLYIAILMLMVTLAECKIYKHPITVKTVVRRRQWKPKKSGDIGGWMVRIVNGDGNFACCGAYISPLMVVTSASCMSPYRNNLRGATAEAAFALDKEDNYALLETVYSPEQFTPGDNLMDVAVVRLQRPIKGKMTEFIKLCEEENLEGTNMTSVGWGYSSFFLKPPSIHPRQISVPVQTTNECRMELDKQEGGAVGVSDSTVCVSHASKNRRDCVYDPGCPLILKDQLCGIVSSGSTCADTSKPFLYTDINKVKNFITNVDRNIKSENYMANHS